MKQLTQPSDHLLTYIKYRQVKQTKRGEIFDREATMKAIKARIEYLRGEIEAERISYGEIAELESLAAYIDPSDTLLRQWAGIQESE